ncbi:MAG: class I SAM-dependent RNA methyltransferase [Eubacteriales bacterium]|nr:class I SAM-dependent RNA methyltransferase [Eubacteriales bacterium]MDD3880844.1 class I SAM-dependent RNA methyltransferase [Eubacteriales bacterium]MDD4511789.1 class I SAM-dependent RNA methyltransferase [Eubacteriales bacterium]
MQFDCIASAAFGLEGVAAKELRDIGFDSVKAENGGARFQADEIGVMRANLWLGTADRVLIVLGEFPARSFDELFEGVRALPWERFISPRGRILVKGKCVRSMLMSVRDCQSITKKAIVERLRDKLNVRVLPEDAEEYSLEVAVVKDVARLTLDTSGAALNKRGYRVLNGEAAIRETLARALLTLSPWRLSEPLYDPCCGSGTFLIEAAMMKSGKAPGLERGFAVTSWKGFDARAMELLREEARDRFKPELACDIAGSDINPEALSYCATHFKKAGFSGIKVEKCDLRELKIEENSGCFICNPPYGERLSDIKTAEKLYAEMGKLLGRTPGWSMGVIATDPLFERCFGRRAKSRRRLYNGRLECEFMCF